MEYVVIGAGSVGMLMSCMLRDAGASVKLITHRKEQADLINEQGIKRGSAYYVVEASEKLEGINRHAIVLLAVKYDALEEILPIINKECPSNPIVFLQNGMLHLEYLKSMPQANIAAGSVEHGVIRISDNEIEHTGKGILNLALLKGEKRHFMPLLDLRRVWTSWHEDFDRMLFRKVLLNSVINPLTALMEIKNGELLTNPYAYELMKDLYMELYRAFPEIDVMLPFEEVTSLCASTAGNTSSMLADKQAGRKMEIDTIIHYALMRSPIELPTLKALYNLLKSAEV